MSALVAAPDDPAALPLEAFRTHFETWLDHAGPEIDGLLAPEPELETRVASARRLQALLHDAGWGRCGWPEAVGGRGGSVLHRATVFDALSRRGQVPWALFEHVEILVPTLIRFARPDLAARTIPALLRGEEGWAQGFSEPDAGSDLASLVTSARRVDGGFVVSGTKIWTSWARYATRCLVLARTGTTEARHRGLSALVVEMDQPGVAVRPIRQANGHDELAEVVLDDVFVADAGLVGQVGDGWLVALHILQHERGTFAWFRNCQLYSRLEASGLVAAADPVALGDVLVDLAASRAAALEAVLRSAAGDGGLDGTAYTKLLLTRAEKALHDLVLATLGTDVTVGSEDPARASLMQQEYQFSRIVSIYGGSQQMQLNSIARRGLGL